MTFAEIIKCLKEHNAYPHLISKEDTA